MKLTHIICLGTLLLGFSVTHAQNSVNNIKLDEVRRDAQREIIHVPDIDGYTTLKCDFHMHTIFSDGTVWPTIRLDEAWMEGLDAISITDHIEGSPYKTDVEGDDNSSWKVVESAGQNYNVILVRAGEITRSMPPGHFNALFIDDANKLDVRDYNEAMAEAQRQGAFVIWNHPGWQAQQPDTCKQFPIHKEWIQKGWIHGVEVANYDEWYPITADWCADQNLAAIGNSDIHGLTAHFYKMPDYRRFMTLVFAEDKNLESLKEAMFARRTVAWFSKHVVGPQKLLAQLFEKSIQVEALTQLNGKAVSKVEISNPTDFTFEFEPMAKGLPAFTLKPHSVYLMNLKTELEGLELPYKIANWFVRTQQPLNVKLVL